MNYTANTRTVYRWWA